MTFDPNQRVGLIDSIYWDANHAAWPVGYICLVPLNDDDTPIPVFQPSDTVGWEEPVLWGKIYNNRNEYVQDTLVEFDPYQNVPFVISVYSSLQNAFDNLPIGQETFDRVERELWEQQQIRHFIATKDAEYWRTWIIISGGILIAVGIALALLRIYGILTW